MDQISRDGYPTSDEVDFANFLRESSCLRSVFPEEVWIRVVDQIRAPEDLLSLSNSSPYFRHLVQDQRVTFLFHKVIEALVPQYEEAEPASCYREVATPSKNFEYYGCYETNQWEAANWDRYHWDEPDFVPYGTPSGRLHSNGTPHHMTGIMKCRLVCSTWNKAIENYYQKTVRILDNRWSYLRSWEVCQLDCYHETPRLFLEHFEESHNQPLEKKNPFLGRAVHIQGLEGEPNFLNLLRQALETYGEEIWYCEITLSNEQISWRLVRMYLNLREWLGLMPNLKSLSIKSSVINSQYRPVGNDERLAGEIERNPVETLRDLEFLDLGDLPAAISNEIIRGNNHVSGLKVSRRRWSQKVAKKKNKYNNFYEVDYDIPGNLENLRELMIAPFSEELLRKLEMEEKCAKNLESLEVRYSTGSALDWERVLKVVNNKWGGTLKELSLKLGDKDYTDRDYDEDRDSVWLALNDGCELKLEMLEKLTILLYEPMGLDFLLGVKNTLEWIRLGTRYERDGDYGSLGEKSKQIVEFFGWEDRMDKSNIWKIFKKLKCVEVRECNCCFYWNCNCVWNTFNRQQ